MRRLRTTITLNEVVVPAFDLTGAHDGPHLSLIGGVHGCEYSSIAAVVEVMRGLDPKDLSGRVTPQRSPFALYADPGSRDLALAMGLPVRRGLHGVRRADWDERRDQGRDRRGGRRRAARSARHAAPRRRTRNALKHLSENGLLLGLGCDR